MLTGLLGWQPSGEGGGSTVALDPWPVAPWPVAPSLLCVCVTCMHSIWPSPFSLVLAAAVITGGMDLMRFIYGSASIGLSQGSVVPFTLAGTPEEVTKQTRSL